RSRSSSAWRTKAIMRSFKRESGLWIPGVSIKMTCASARFTTPRMRLRVVCGAGVTIETFSPTSALVSVLLPALGRPTTATNPDLIGGSGPGARGSGFVVPGADFAHNLLHQVLDGDEPGDGPVFVDDDGELRGRLL